MLPYPIIAGLELYISDLLVAEEGRGKGVGGSLLAKAEVLAKENRCVRVMLNNPKESEGYQREFYKKHGYTERIKFANFVKMLE
jgi:GNAT superfamily N-acetyltransferase